MADKVDMDRLMPALERSANLRRIKSTMLSMASANQPGIREWFVLHTMTGGEKTVESALKAQHVHTYLPTVEGGKMVIRHRVVNRGSRPALPGYILVSVVPSSAAFSGLRCVDGVIGLVGGSEKPHKINDADVIRFKALLGQLEGSSVHSEKFAKGDMVRFEEGPFIGYSGRIAKIRKLSLRRGEAPVGVEAIVELRLADVEHSITTPLALLEKL
ncbi:transcription termination/antitermination protein NusG [Rhizobium tibeticum]|nr:transcription termination/antitermination protein NusG [Rhizobium tibeticum]